MEEDDSRFKLNLNSQQKPSVDIIVVNWNGIDHLQVCLSALLNQTYKNINIIFVDNGSTDESIKFVKESFPSITILAFDKNNGFCKANNYAMENSQSEFIALINNDTEADPQWISSAITTLTNHNDVGFVASRICFFDKRDLIDTCGDLYFSSGYPEKRGWLNLFSDEFNSPKYVFGACAGAAVYRRSMLNKIGFFDEEYFAYQEDIDLSFRAQLQGYQCLYDPKSIVFHKVGSTAKKMNSSRIFWSHRNHLYTLIKNLPLSLAGKYFFDIFFAEIAVFLSSILQKNLKVFIKARIAVFCNLKGLLKKRKIIQAKKISSDKYIDSIISKSWISQRLSNKKLEKKLMDSPSH